MEINQKSKLCEGGGVVDTTYAQTMSISNLIKLISPKIHFISLPLFERGISKKLPAGIVRMYT